MAPKKAANPGKSASYYRKNPKARARKKAYDTAYHSTPERKKYRSKLATERRRRGIMGKGGSDVSHTKNGGTKLESPKKNRGRNGHGRRGRLA